MADTIALTGATGFVGAAVARRLTTAGHRIQALIRPASIYKQPADIAAEWIAGDLDDVQSLQRLVKGVAAVIHCAGAVRGSTREHFNRINADGLARLVRATVNQHPMPRLLLISSLSAREPHLSHYAASKRQGERLLTEQSHQLSWTIYRPCAVYGPGDREILPVFKWMAKGIAPVLGSGNGRFSLIYVNDLAEAIATWLDRNCCQSGTYELHDGNPGGYSWHDVINTIRQLRRKAMVRLQIPLVLVKLTAALNLLAARTVGYAPMLTPGKVCELSHPDWVCDNAALISATGWTPKILLPEGLQLTLSA
ncbi:Nucleoside-diphosphate-sugar epimerase [Olavius sp. associated proteobacterium Delta 1]|nr:Nucleoside-diphosphate-sugar epimerase [Olavius sp. associated proteobacterium Delta 1]